MASSKFYKLWIWNQGTLTWSEFTTFQGMAMSDGYNSTPRMSVNVFTRDATQQSILTANAFYRVTKLDSTNGNNGTIIQTGSLDEPISDEKSIPPGSSKPISYQLEGSGLASKVNQMVFDNTIPDPDNANARFAPVVTGSGSSVISTIVSNINSRTPGTLTTGTLDTGPSVSVKFRQANALQSILEIGSIGDSTDKFQYAVSVGAVLSGSKYIPAVHYLKPSNSTFLYPNGVTGTRNTDPVPISDNTRIIEEIDEIRAMQLIKENDRLRNAVNVKFFGVGTGNSVTSNAGQQETGYSTDSTSISNFGRRESNLYAPWIQNSSTATTYRGTMLDTFRGKHIFNSTYPGVLYATIQMRSGELYSSALNANLGDVVAVRRRDGTIAITQRLLMWSYDQQTECLTYTIGLPRVKAIEVIAQSQTQLRNNYNAMEKTNFKGQSTSVPGALDSSIIAYSGVGTLNVGSNQTTISSGDIINTVGTTTGALSGGYQVRLDVNLLSATLNSTIQFPTGVPPNSKQGFYPPYAMVVELSGGSAVNKEVGRVEGTELNRSAIARYTFSYPYTLSNTDGQITTARVTLVRYPETSLRYTATGITNSQTASIQVTVTVFRVPPVVIVTDHVHYM